MSKRTNFFQNLQNLASKAEEAVKETSKQLNAAANQAYEKVVPTINEVAQNITDFADQTYTVSEEKVNEAAAFLTAHAPSFDNGSKVLSLDEIGRKIASLGVPAIAFAVAASIAGGMGLAGGAIVTTALAMLGGPAGMIGGLVALGILTVIADAVGKYGIEAVLFSTFKARRDQGISIEQIHTEIDGLWISIAESKEVDPVV